MPRRLLIEGWRGIHHSYALVAQAHCLCLLGRRDVELRFRDLPYHSPAWRTASGLFDADDERAIAGIPAPEASFAPDATLSLQAQRQDFTAPLHGLKFVFGTPEHRVLLAENVAPFRSAADVAAQVHVVTPSRWTALAYERFGFEPQRVHVVPHGIDPIIVHPDEASRAAIRKALGLQDAFVFLSVGAMTPNKGIDLLLGAFAEVAQREPDARLLLKGADDLYPSQDHVRTSLNRLPARTSRDRRHEAALPGQYTVGVGRWRRCCAQPTPMSRLISPKASTCRCSRLLRRVSRSSARPAGQPTSSRTSHSRRACRVGS